MYQEFYGLTEKPFSLTPNPQFLFYSRQYREAEDQLLYGISNREGFMLVTGQPGTGKTTLCRDLIEKLDLRKYRSALIFNPFLSGEEMLAALLTEFGITPPPGANRKELLDRLNAYLLEQLAAGRSCVAIFDEAQHLSTEFLEQIRVLSNLETHQEKLIQIILVGQPELLENILSPRMAQLDQRVSIRCTLSDLDLQETDRYIHHRLNVAGSRGEIRFNKKAVEEIYRASGGVPRRVNLICDRALLAAYAEQMRDVNVQHVRKATQALRGDDAGDATASRARRGGRAAVGVATSGGGAGWLRWAAVAAVVVVAGGVISAVAFWPAHAEPGDEALYWSATMASSPAAAERSLVELVQKYPTSRHMDESLLQLARLEMERGDHAAALATLGQLSRREPAGQWHQRAMLWSGLVQLDAADTVAACASAQSAAADSTVADALLASQTAELTSLCAARAASDSTAASAAAAVSDSVKPHADSIHKPRTAGDTTHAPAAVAPGGATEAERA